MIYISELEKNLRQDTFIKEVIYFDSIASTNDYCKKLADKDDVLVAAGYQTAGKGRFDRVWESEKGKNLLFSIKKKIPRNSKNFCSVNFYFTYFLLEGIISHLESGKYNFIKEYFEIKWPNDLLYNKKKFCGILIESVVNKNDFIIGIGINVNQVEFSSSLETNTTSLSKITSQEINLTKLLTEIISGFSNNLFLLNEEKDVEIHRLWKSRCKNIGEMVRYINNEGIEENAQIIDINEDGSIKLLKNGEIANYFSGEIKLLTN